MCKYSNSKRIEKALLNKLTKKESHFHGKLAMIKFFRNTCQNLIMDKLPTGQAGMTGKYLFTLRSIHSAFFKRLK
jgi:hypothetical protein